MSDKQQIVIITPPVSPTIPLSETFKFFGFECPQCCGAGGWLVEQKNYFDEPERKICKTCSGKGKLTAKVTVEWLPNESEK